jgi:8-oxo-dGTP diphosphatase
MRNDGGDFAVVRSREGIYLPGGGMDPGETPHETVIRETLEECGLTIRIGSWTASAIQFAWSETEQTFFEKRCTFVDATVSGSDTSRLEPDHELLWVDADRAVELLTHEGHGWAVRQANSIARDPRLTAAPPLS